MNNATIEAAIVPSSLAPTATAEVQITVRNTGTTTWPAQSAFRLATTSSNGVKWLNWACGGYFNTKKDARVYTCTTTAPGQSHVYKFKIKMPGSATGSRSLSVQMVQDGVAFFGQPRSWPITVIASSLPDVVVQSVSMSPTNPSAGQLVKFSAVVRNNGTVATPSGVLIGVGYKIDGTQVAFGTVNGPLAAGATVTVPTTSGVWQAQSGTHTLTAIVDDINRFAESNEGNNSTSVSFTVGVVDPPTSALGLWGMNIDPANPGGNPSATQLRDIGVGWVRVEWKHPQGFGYYEPILTAYRAAGLKVMLLIDYASMPILKPASNASDAEWNAYRPAFNEQVRTIAQYYGGRIDAWQIWNEQDLNAPGQVHDYGVPAHQYAPLLRDAVNVVRAHSSAPIVWGGLCSGNPAYVGTVRTTLGGTLPGDYIAVHPYGQRAPDNWPNSTWGHGNMSTLLNSYLAYGKKLIVSEIGCDTTDTTFQAKYLENVYKLVRDSYAGRVLSVFWFCWSDAMVPNYGVVYSNGSPKLSHTRYREVALGLPAALPDAGDVVVLDPEGPIAM
jgi:hypothetical protein